MTEEIKITEEVTIDENTPIDNEEKHEEGEE